MCSVLSIHLFVLESLDIGFAASSLITYIYLPVFPSAQPIISRRIFVQTMVFVTTSTLFVQSDDVVCAKSSFFVQNVDIFRIKSTLFLQNFEQRKKKICKLILALRLQVVGIVCIANEFDRLLVT